MRPAATAWLLVSAIGCAACAPALPAAARHLLIEPRFELAGTFSIAPGTSVPPMVGPQFGGLSGLAFRGRAAEFVAISDERVGSRAFLLRIAGEGASFSVQPLDAVPLEGGARVPRLDPEGIVSTADGRMFISSEGIGNDEPRAPPAIVEFTAAGAFVRSLPVRDRFVPEPAGAQTRGVRSNYGFEALTISPDGRRLFTATETALVQDGEVATFESGARARLLEYRALGDSFEPAREFVYPLDPIDRVDFQAGLSVAGIVELLALNDRELLALERTYIEEAGGSGRGVNRARLFRVSLDGATDVSAIDSLATAGAVTPVRKTAVLNLGELANLPPALSNLDNFEGLAFGPTLADGSPSILVISDDNFNVRQRSWFVLLRIRSGIR